MSLKILNEIVLISRKSERKRERNQTKKSPFLNNSLTGKNSKDSNPYKPSTIYSD